jgi:hypothetical protein
MSLHIAFWVQALKKLEGSLASGHPYEGHELFKTVFHRFRARLQNEDSYKLAHVSRGTRHD